MILDQQSNPDTQDADGFPASIRRSACFLLVVLLCGLASAPIAIYYRWRTTAGGFWSSSANIDSSIDGRIAFITPDHQLATIAPNGSQKRVLSDVDERLRFPTWDPVSSNLAVIGDGRIYMLSDIEDKGDMVRLYENTEQEPIYLYWSPDGQRLTFLSNHPDGLALQLTQTNVEEAESLVLTSGRSVYWDWSADAKEILVHTDFRGEDSELALINTEAGNRQWQIDGTGLFQAPGISKESAYKAFSLLGQDGFSRLVIEDSAGVRQIVVAHLDRVAFSWSPKEDLLAYLAPSFNSTGDVDQLRVVDPDTGVNRVLSPDPVMAFFWSPDGRSIAYLSIPDRDDGRVNVAAGSDLHRPNTLQRLQSRVQLELWVVEVQRIRPTRMMTFVPSPTFAHQVLPYFDQYALSHRLWSPDSKALVIPLSHEGASMIAVVPTTGAEVRLLAEGEVAFWSQQ